MGILAAFAVLTVPSASAATPDSYLLTTTEAADIIGKGQNRSFTGAAGDTFTWKATPTTVDVSVKTLSNGTWRVVLVPPDGDTIKPGRYLRALNTTVRIPAVPGLSVLGNGVGCRGKGHFDVLTADYDSANVMTRFDATFEYFCDNRSPIRGRLGFGMGAVPEPLPARDPDPTQVVLDSSPGDPVLNGVDLTMSVAGGAYVTSWGNSWQLGTAFIPTPGDLYNFIFTAPAGSPLAPGNYTGVPTRPIQSTHTGLEIKHIGEECGQSEANFTVHEIVWGPDDNFDYALLRFRASFEQLCGSGRLRGEMTIGRPDPPSVSTRIDSPRYPPAYFKLASPPGALIGASEFHSYAVNEKDDFQATAAGNLVTVKVREAGGNVWDMVFGAAAGETVQPGQYVRTQHRDKAGAGPALELRSGMGGCSGGNGHFDVAEASYGEGGKLNRFDATFSYLCLGGLPVNGAIRLGIEGEPADPALTPPAQATMSYSRRLAGGPETTQTFSSAEGHLVNASIGYNPPEMVAGGGQAPATAPVALYFTNTPGKKLVAGDYPGALSLFQSHPERPRIHVLDFGQGSCTQMTGSFRVLKAGYGFTEDHPEERLLEFHAVFQTRCGNFYTTRGEIRWSMPPVSPQYATASSWGWNGFGELGNAKSGDVQDSRTLSSLGSVGQVSTGFVHSLAVKQDGTVWAWGWNALGQLGDGTTSDRTSPVRVKGLSDVKYVSAGVYHSLAVKNDGSVWAWGWNALGQLGDGTLTDRHVPVRVQSMSNATKVSAGYLHSVALGEGSLYSWGWNGVGQLGDGTLTDRIVPTRTAGGGHFSDVSAGWLHNLAVSDGKVYGWGWNVFGQLGDGSREDRPSPTAAVNLTTATRVSAGFAHSLAVEESGFAYGWGWNALGQLGNGGTTDYPTPSRVNLPDPLTEISAGLLHSVAAGEGRAWAWGSNVVSQLGDGTTRDRLNPVSVPGAFGVVGVAAGGYHNMAAGFARNP